MTQPKIPGEHYLGILYYLYISEAGQIHVQSFSKHLLSTYYILETVLWIRVTCETKQRRFLLARSLRSMVQTVSLYSQPIEQSPEYRVTLSLLHCPFSG